MKAKKRKPKDGYTSTPKVTIKFVMDGKTTKLDLGFAIACMMTRMTEMRDEIEALKSAAPYAINLVVNKDESAK